MCGAVKEVISLDENRMAQFVPKTVPLSWRSHPNTSSLSGETVRMELAFAEEYVTFNRYV